jgi:tetratricopeptide (TPR) repeat protein
MKKIAIAAVLVAGWAGPALADGYSFLNVGIDYLNQQRYADAVTWLDKAIAAGDLIPDQMHVAHLDRARALAELDRPAESAAAFTAALAIRPDDLGARIGRSFAYVAAAQPENAADDIAAAHISTSKIAGIVFERGLVAWELGNYLAAGEAFSQLADKGYTDAWLWVQLANIRQNKPVTKYVGFHIADLKINLEGIPYFWPGPAMSLYAGSKSEADVLSAMEGDFASQEAECQGNFYLGAWRLVHGNAGGAKELLQKAVNACPAGDIEWRMANFELKKL